MERIVQANIWSCLISLYISLYLLLFNYLLLFQEMVLGYTTFESLHTLSILLLCISLLAWWNTEVSELCLPIIIKDPSNFGRGIFNDFLTLHRLSTSVSRPIRRTARTFTPSNKMLESAHIESWEWEDSSRWQKMLIHNNT